MSHNVVAALVAASVIAFLGSAPRGHAEDALVTYKSLSPEVALDVAQAALKRCRADGFQVAVAVVDRFGQTLVMLRDRYAGLPAPETATDKAYRRASFRSNTSELVKSVQSGQLSAGLGSLPRVRFLAGGVVIEAAGTLVGAVGVSGAPRRRQGRGCAKAGVEAIRDKLDF